METRDWSLVFFTVLTQAAVGAFLVLQVLRYLSDRRRARDGARATDDAPGAAPPGDGTRRDGPEARGDGLGAADERSTGREAAVPLLIVLAVLSAGLLAALFHLSTPLQAARAVVNFSTSWLSREIVFGSLFAALLGVLAWREWRAADAAPDGAAREERAAGAARERLAAGAAPDGRTAADPAPHGRTAADPAPAASALAAWLPRLTAAAGLAFLGCQTAIYLLPAQPAWNSFATPAAFGGTTLRLGVLGVAAALVGRGLTPGGDDLAGQPATTPETVLRGLALVGIAALALEFAIVPLHLAALSGEGSAAAAASAERLTGDYGGVLLLRLGLLAAAAVALGGVLALTRRPLLPSRHRLAAALASGALGLALVSEVCGRFLFYAMRVRVGI